LKLVLRSKPKKDAKKIAAAGLKPKASELLEILRKNPYQNPPPFENWWEISQVLIRGESTFSTGLSIKILDDLNTVKAIRMWTHYEG